MQKFPAAGEPVVFADKAAISPATAGEGGCPLSKQQNDASGVNCKQSSLRTQRGDG